MWDNKANKNTADKWMSPYWDLMEKKWKMKEIGLVGYD